MEGRGLLRRLLGRCVHALFCLGVVWVLPATTAWPSTEPCPLSFVDATPRSGVEFVHDAGRSGAKHLPETMGSGVAWLDFDGDGWLDLFFVQSGAFPPAVDQPVAHRLFRSVGPTAEGEVRFVDASHLLPSIPGGYGQGVLAFDVEGDGDQDLLLTAIRGTSPGDSAITLLRNGGAGFSAEALEQPEEPFRWATSATAADVDGDGDLDLFVAHYLAFDPRAEVFCGRPATAEAPAQPEYCDPSLFVGQQDLFWRNQGGMLQLGAEKAPGLPEGAILGKGLGALFVDVNDDEWPDLYVANDITPNHLFLGGAGGFIEDGLLAGVAVNADGKPEAGMGLAVLDVDRDGDADLAVTNFDVETNTLYFNLGSGAFDDRSAASGFGVPSFNYLGFGLIAEDFDLDGWVDVYAANGHIFERPARANVAYRQPDLVLRGGAGRFVATGCAVDGFPERVSRGAASADFDLDGDIDLVLTHIEEAAVVARNVEEPSVDGWIGVTLRGGGSNTDAVGARVRLRSSDGGTADQTRWVVAGGSYLSSSARDLRFGVEPEVPVSLEVRWPSGGTLRIESPPRGRVLRVAQPDRLTGETP